MTPKRLRAALSFVALTLLGVALAACVQPPDGGAPAGRTPEPKPVAVFLGDSYTEGTPGVMPRWVDVLAAEKGWRAVNMGASGTGFTTRGSPARSTYGERVPEVIAARPAVVVVSTAGNDGVTDITQAAGDVFAALRAGLPGARIVAVAPFRFGSGGPTGDLAAQMRAAATTAGVEWVDPEDPLLGRADLLADGVHPTVEGHALLAEAVSKALG